MYMLMCVRVYSVVPEFTAYGLFVNISKCGVGRWMDGCPVGVTL